MLLIPAAIRKIKEEGRVEGRVLGRRELIAEYDAWFRRSQEAQAKGQEVTEPPPSA